MAYVIAAAALVAMVCAIIENKPYPAICLLLYAISMFLYGQCEHHNDKTKKAMRKLAEVTDGLVIMKHAETQHKMNRAIHYGWKQSDQELPEEGVQVLLYIKEPLKCGRSTYLIGILRTDYKGKKMFKALGARILISPNVYWRNIEPPHL